MLNRSAATVIRIAFMTALAGSAIAGELGPIEAQRVSLGPVSGIVYFTAHGASDTLVATLGAGDALPSVRFEANLLAGQSAVLSVPREAGKAAISVRFERQSDRILVFQDPAS